MSYKLRKEINSFQLAGEYRVVVYSTGAVQLHHSTGGHLATIPNTTADFRETDLFKDMVQSFIALHQSPQVDFQDKPKAAVLNFNPLSPALAESIYRAELTLAEKALWGISALSLNLEVAPDSNIDFDELFFILRSRPRLDQLPSKSLIWAEFKDYLAVDWRLLAEDSHLPRRKHARTDWFLAQEKLFHFLNEAPEDVLWKEYKNRGADSIRLKSLTLKEVRAIRLNGGLITGRNIDDFGVQQVRSLLFTTNPSKKGNYEPEISDFLRRRTDEGAIPAVYTVPIESHKHLETLINSGGHILTLEELNRIESIIEEQTYCKTPRVHYWKPAAANMLWAVLGKMGPERGLEFFSYIVNLHEVHKFTNPFTELAGLLKKSGYRKKFLQLFAGDFDDVPVEWQPALLGLTLEQNSDLINDGIE